MKRQYQLYMGLTTFLRTLSNDANDWSRREVEYVGERKYYDYIMWNNILPVIKISLNVSSWAQDYPYDLISLAYGIACNPAYDLHLLDEDLVNKFFDRIREVYRL